MRNRLVAMYFLILAGTGDTSAQYSRLPAALGVLQGHLEVKLRRYNGTAIKNEMEFRQNEIRENGNIWKLDWQVTESKNGLDVTLRCKLQAGSSAATALALNFAFGGWDTENYVLVPGVVYNGNRYRAIGNGYNPPYPGDMYYNPAVPLTISNNPRLALEKGVYSGLELQTTNTATPALSFFSPALKKGWIVLTEQATRLGNSGLFIEENGQRDSCVFRITAPVVRKMAAGFGDFHASGDKAPDWQEGDEVAIRFHMHVFKAADIPALLVKLMDQRKAVAGPNDPRNLWPMSELVKLGTDISRNNFVETKAGKYYLPENNRDFQLGWVSGMINTFPLLALNTEPERSRVAEQLDFIVSCLQGASGYFYGSINAEGKLGTEKAHPGFPAMQAMVRKNGDVLFWLIKHMMLLKAQGHGAIIKPQWEQAAQQLAAAFISTWQQHGEFGQYIVPETGEVAVFNSTAGAIVPAGLALAAAYFNKPAWLKVAENAAEFYFKRDVQAQGFTSGACGDISQDADSETAFGFLESLMALYNYTGKQMWLNRAKVQAALCASWTLAYNPLFPAPSTIAKLQGRMAGAVWASSQNKHAAPGVCTSSADYLFKLYRATGEEKYAELIRDIQHAHAEAVNMPGHITSNYRIGSSMERIQPSDAEGQGAIGNFIYTRNSWTETNGVLMAMELPGIYVRPGKRQLYVFDHVNVIRLLEDKSSVTLQLSNHTAYDANVSVFAETEQAASKAPGYTAFLHWPKVFVPFGKEITIRVWSNGKVSVTGKEKSIFENQ